MSVAPYGESLVHTPESLAALTPREVDERLAVLHFESWKHAAILETLWPTLHRLAGDRQHKEPTGGTDWRGKPEYVHVWNLTDTEALTKAEARIESDNLNPYTRSELTETVTEITVALQALKAARREIRTLDGEYALRPWTRAYVVLNSNGHVHTSMSCSTCFPTTRFGWLTELSGQDEATIVNAIGSDACTVCYPTAPVESLSKTRTVFALEEREEQEQQRARDAEKAARLAAKQAKSLSVDGSTVELRWTIDGHRYYKELKTYRAAELFYIDGASGDGFDPVDDATLAHVLALMAEKKGVTEADVLAGMQKRIDKKAAAKRTLDEEIARRRQEYQAARRNT